MPSIRSSTDLRNNYLSFSSQGANNRLAAKGRRWIGVKNYMVLYTIDEQEKAVYVERILSGRRDWARIL